MFWERSGFWVETLQRSSPSAPRTLRVPLNPGHHNPFFFSLSRLGCGGLVFGGRGPPEGARSATDLCILYSLLSLFSIKSEISIFLKSGKIGIFEEVVYSDANR